MNTRTLLQVRDSAKDGPAPATQDDPAAQGADQKLALVADTYQLVDRIGEGAMGVVYEAEHVRLGRRFALKLLRAEAWTKPTALQRFMREARIAASVHSEHVVSIIDCGQLPDGAPFLVTELLLGQDLRARLDEAKVLPVGEAVRIAIEACQGISAVHAAGIVHRDLKPENLFLAARDSGKPVCKLLDFGVAKLAAQPVTEDGRLIGTASYMAPEQILDASRVGPEADIYSIGAILFECLSGRTPHDGTTTHAVMFKAVHYPAPNLEDFRSELPPGLSDAVNRALAPDPVARFRSARELEEALAPFAEGTRDSDPSGLRPGPSAVGGGFAGGKARAPMVRLIAAAAGGAVLGALVVAGFLTPAAQRPVPVQGVAPGPALCPPVVAAPTIVPVSAVSKPPEEIAFAAVAASPSAGAVGARAAAPSSNTRSPRALQPSRAAHAAASPVVSAAAAPVLETRSPYQIP
jgi:tRNA A-37 threonylcarbamoyl transferase component Bud32